MKKEMFLFIGVILMIILGNALVSGAVCCEKLKSTSLWCQGATDKSQCDAKYSFWLYKQDVLNSCEDVADCLGTCISKNTGECSQRIDKAECTESGGTWDEKAPEEISACHEICCLLGQEAWFINPTACDAKSTLYGIKGTPRPDITTREDCEALRKNTEVGACVVSTPTENTCRILTGTECTPANIGKLSQYLQNSAARDQISVEFKNGLLCTASENGKPISSCSPSANTECKDNKVYFKDLCGNFANIYNSSMFSETRETWTKAMNDYWTFMQDPYYSKNVCNVSSSGSNTCGNCDPYNNTVCKNYGETTFSSNPPKNNANGLVCGDLSCKYKDTATGITKTYQHGESWCVGTASTFPIHINLTTSEISKSNVTALKNASKYNLPGSRYYKLVCSAGEVTVQECGDYRNSVCMEGTNDDSKQNEAFCVFNNWRTCFQIDTKTNCEDNGSLCKWIPGYTWVPGQIVPEDQREEKQGSCVPLIAPGFDFWSPTSQGNAICSMANIQDAAMFETGIFTARKTLTGTNMDAWPLKGLANQCTNGCYTIPGYAKEFNQVIYPNGTVEAKVYPEDIKSAPSSNYQVLTMFYYISGFPLPKSVSSYSLSIRRGQYCNKDGKPDQWLTGKVRGNAYDCTTLFGSDAKNDRKTRDSPVYLTNDEWLRSITERARALGDCGYKMSINGKYDDPATEMITSIFQKLKQSGAVKKNVTVEQIIYKGGAYLKGDLEKYETTLATSSKTYTCAQTHLGICASTVNNPEPCNAEEGGTLQEAADGEALCPDKNVCCVYPQLN